MVSQSEAAKHTHAQPGHTLKLAEVRVCNGGPGGEVGLFKMEIRELLQYPMGKRQECT